jgi:hypothetical protein
MEAEHDQEVEAIGDAHEEQLRVLQAAVDINVHLAERRERRQANAVVTLELKAKRSDTRRAVAEDKANEEMLHRMAMEEVARKTAKKNAENEKALQQLRTPTKG